MASEQGAEAVGIRYAFRTHAEYSNMCPWPSFLHNICTYNSNYRIDTMESWAGWKKSREVMTHDERDTSEVAIYFDPMRNGDNGW